MAFQALRKEPLTVYGDGKQTRSFQYVSDLVSPSINRTFECSNIISYHNALRSTFVSFKCIDLFV
jgi:dTDP-D-glucose 4,6-dehydratase